VHDGSAICPKRETNDFGLLNGAASGFIGRRYDNVREGASLDLGGAFQALQHLVR